VIVSPEKIFDNRKIFEHDEILKEIHK